MNRLLSKKNVADFCGFSTRTLNRKIQKREIAYIRVGRLVKFKEEDLKQFIDSHRIRARAV